MQIQPVYNNTNISHKKILLGTSIKDMQKSFNRPAKFKLDTEYLQKSIRKFDLHKKENVDIILHYTENDGYFAFVADKQGEIPNVSNAKHEISKDPEIIERFCNWINLWDDFFAKKETV